LWWEGEVCSREKKKKKWKKGSGSCGIFRKIKLKKKTPASAKNNKFGFIVNTNKL
jgi:hypothetical protein